MMRLGTRWTAGGEPPRQVPEPLRALVRELEAAEGVTGGWTLTWLEGRGIVEHDDGRRFRDTPDGVIALSDEDENQ